MPDIPNTSDRSGIQEHNRRYLEVLHRSLTGPFTAAQAAGALHHDTQATVDTRYR